MLGWVSEKWIFFWPLTFQISYSLATQSLLNMSFLSWRTCLYHFAFLCLYLVMFSSCCVFFHCQNCIPGTSTNLLPTGCLALECPHGRATRTWSLLSSLCTSSYLDRWRVQSRGIFEQDTLVPCSSELLTHPPLCRQTTAEPAGTGESRML